MTHPEDYRGLASVLQRATDRIAADGLAAPALAEARRRRAHRRVATGTAAAVAAVAVGGALGVRALTDPGDTEPVGPTRPSSTTTPSSNRSQTPPPPTSTRSRAAAPPIDPAVVQPKWDPRDVDELPSAPAHVVAALPDVVDPPKASTPLADAPIPAAVLVVDMGSAAQLLSTDDEWRSVPLTGRFPRLALSPKGTSLAVYDAQDDPDGQIVVYDLSTGESHPLSYPDGYEGWDFTSWAWVDEESLLLLHGGAGGWLVDPESGDATQVPYPGPTLWWSIDRKGAVVESAEWGAPADLTDWAGGEPRRVSMRITGRLSFLHANADTVVGTSDDGHPFSAIVADRETLTPQAVLPIRDHEANFSNWGLRVLALQDDGTVLLRVAAIDPEVDGFRVVAWEPTSGELSIVSTNSLPVGRNVAFADALLRE